MNSDGAADWRDPETGETRSQIFDRVEDRLVTHRVDAKTLHDLVLLDEIIAVFRRAREATP